MARTESPPASDPEQQQRDPKGNPFISFKGFVDDQASAFNKAFTLPGDNKSFPSTLNSRDSDNGAAKHPMSRLAELFATGGPLHVTVVFGDGRKVDLSNQSTAQREKKGEDFDDGNWHWHWGGMRQGWRRRHNNEIGMDNYFKGNENPAHDTSAGKQGSNVLSGKRFDSLVDEMVGAWEIGNKDAQDMSLDFQKTFAGLNGDVKSVQIEGEDFSPEENARLNAELERLFRGANEKAEEKPDLFQRYANQPHILRLLHYLDSNPISPPSLDLGGTGKADAEAGSKWRQAFEDLLRSEKGDEIHGPGLHGAEAPGDADPGERFLSLAERAKNKTGAVTPPGSPRQSKPASVLSTLTTTERVMQADGSISVKTILKKRFADGKEDVTEKVETTPAPSKRKDSMFSEVGEEDKKSFFWGKK